MPIQATNEIDQPDPNHLIGISTMAGATIVHRFVPQPAQVPYIRSPADITVFGGARGGGKTTGSLGDWWLHAEAHQNHARGLMVRKTRTDLKDTQLAAMTMFGNAATWKEHGSYFDFKNGARLYMAFLENERDAQAYQGWSLTRVYLEEITQFSSLEPMLRLLATLRSRAWRALPDEMHLQSGRPQPFRGEKYVYRQWRVQPGQGRGNRADPGFYPVEDRRQSGLAGERPELHQPAEGGWQSAAGQGLAGR